MEKPIIKDVCRTYLSWTDPDKISLRRLGKGCSNDIWVASLEDGDQTTSVLVRIYGSIIREKVTQDVYINCYMGALGKGPRILGLFEGGRLEEYIDSEPMTRSRFSADYDTIIRMIAEYQNIDMPLPKTSSTLEVELRRMVEMVKCEKWRSEVEWYLDTLAEIAPLMTPLRFCHNDVNMQNFLLPRGRSRDLMVTGGDPTESMATAGVSMATAGVSMATPGFPKVTSQQLVLIDWEYAGYNHPLFDIANYCCEMQYDWSCPEPPYFVFNKDWLPGDETLVSMVRLHKSLLVPRVETPDDILLKQLKFLILGSELVWTIWALSLDQSFNLGMEEYFEAKKTSYLEKKERYDSDVKYLLDLSKTGNGVPG